MHHIFLLIFIRLFPSFLIFVGIFKYIRFNNWYNKLINLIIKMSDNYQIFQYAYKRVM